MRSPDLRKTASLKMASARHQTGVVLLITLIVLVAMTLAAIALMRSVDTGIVVAGNMAFKQGATLAGDAGTEAAINWLSTQIVNNEAALYDEDQTAGYYPISPKHSWNGVDLDWDMTGNGDPADPNRTMVNWDFPAAPPCAGTVSVGFCKRPSAAVPGMPAGTEVKYVIHRLCLLSGDPNLAGNNCSTTAANVAGVSAGGKDYTVKTGFSGVTQTPHYRITSRIRGPRNTISYVEAIVHF